MDIFYLRITPRHQMLQFVTRERTWFFLDLAIFFNPIIISSARRDEFIIGIDKEELNNQSKKWESGLEENGG